MHETQRLRPRNADLFSDKLLCDMRGEFRNQTIEKEFPGRVRERARR